MTCHHFLILLRFVCMLTSLHNPIASCKINQHTHTQTKGVRNVADCHPCRVKTPMDSAPLLMKSPVAEENPYQIPPNSLNLRIFHKTRPTHQPRRHLLYNQSFQNPLTPEQINALPPTPKKTQEIPNQTH